jgi:hypothetical protein
MQSVNAVKTSRPFQERFLDGCSRKPFLALGISFALSIAVPLNRIGERPSTDGPIRHLATGLQAAVQTAISGETQASDHIRADFFLKHVPFGSVIYDAARKHHVSPELVAAVAHAESAFHPGARSHSGAVGIMQLVPRTGRWLGVTDLADPIQNIVAGAKYLRYLSDRFGGNEDHVIAAYNAGEGNVRRFDGVPPFNETRDYVERVHRFQRDLRAQMTGQVADASSYRERFAAMPARSRTKIDIHWTTPEERRLRRAS